MQGPKFKKKKVQNVRTKSVFTPQKNDFSATTKRLGRKFWMGHVFAKGKVS